MKVRVLLIHPESGIRDAVIENAPSVEEVVRQLKENDCQILVAEEEK